MTAKQQKLVTTLEMIRIEEFILSSYGCSGRRPEDRVAIARAFVAKTVYNMSTTRALLDRLETDISLRRICGWERKNDISAEWTFSRAFAEFSESQLPERIHFYIFDEWAADQDPEFKELFYTELLPALTAKGKTVLAITHDDRYFHLADRCIKMEEGQITSIQCLSRIRLFQQHRKNYSFFEHYNQILNNR